MKPIPNNTQREIMERLGFILEDEAADPRYAHWNGARHAEGLEVVLLAEWEPKGGPEETPEEEVTRHIIRAAMGHQMSRAKARFEAVFRLA